MKTDKLATLIPLSLLEQSAQQQIYTILDLDIVEKVALMPDAHSGYYAPIGSVCLVREAISPWMVGYDIGCGMCGINTMVPYSEFEKHEEKIFNDILKNIPCGTGIQNSQKQAYSHEFKSAICNKNLDNQVNAKLLQQLGTLGGGNHFIELGTTKDDFLMIILHSGSRNPGHSVGGFYMKLSKNSDKHLPGEYFDIKSDNGRAYLEDMNFMLQYALDNRRLMMSKILQILGLPNILMQTMINENHNHALVSDNYVLHRKGATPADVDQLGLIPGNMRDGSYVTKGLGNAKYLSSASHGAGRKMSRKAANEKIKFDIFEKQMKGIRAVVNKSILDEAPDAYKDIDDVIQKQNRIVINVIDKVTPKINVKGI